MEKYPVEEDRAFRDTLCVKDTKAIDTYINQCWGLNQALRDGLDVNKREHAQEHPDYANQINTLDSILARATANRNSKPKNVTLYRGINSASISGRSDGFLYHPHYMSTSTETQGASQFTGEHGCLFVINVNINDINMMYVHKNKTTSENEVLLQRRLYLKFFNKRNHGKVAVFSATVSTTKPVNTSLGPDSPSSLASSCELITEQDIIDEIDVLRDFGEDPLIDDVIASLTAMACSDEHKKQVSMAVHAYFENNPITPAYGGGKHRHTNGRSYKVRTGPRGGQYIVVAGKRKYIKHS